MFSGEDVDSRRLSQIFESLSCWNDLKNLETTISSSSGGSGSGNVNLSTSGGGGGIGGSNASSNNDLQFLSANNSTSSSSPPLSTSNPSTSSSLFLAATTITSKRSSTGGAFLVNHNQSSPNHQQVVNNTIPPPNHNLRHLGHVTSRSTPNSPRLMPRRAQSTASASKSFVLAGGEGNNLNSSGGGFGGESSSPWLNLANLTEYLDVHQLNNYQQNVPEVSFPHREWIALVLFEMLGDREMKTGIEERKF